MKITKTVFKKLLKECILELQQEGKLGGTALGGGQTPPGGGVATPAGALNQQVPGRLLPGMAVSGNIFEAALLDTLMHEMPAHRAGDMSGMRVTGLAPEMPPGYVNVPAMPVRPPPQPQQQQQHQQPPMALGRGMMMVPSQPVVSPAGLLAEQQPRPNPVSQKPVPVVPVTDQTDVVPPGVTGMLPGAERWAQIAFSTKSKRNL